MFAVRKAAHDWLFPPAPPPAPNPPSPDESLALISKLTRLPILYTVPSASNKTVASEARLHRWIASRLF